MRKRPRQKIAFTEKICSLQTGIVPKLSGGLKTDCFTLGLEEVSCLFFFLLSRFFLFSFSCFTLTFFFYLYEDRAKDLTKGIIKKRIENGKIEKEKKYTGDKKQLKIFHL